MFTRRFHAEFDAPGPEVARWLQQSTGTREAVTERVGDATLEYRIEPGAGAQDATVTIDEATSSVTIRVGWS